MPYHILRLLLLCLFTATVVHAQTPPNLVVAWVENGDVWVWRATDNISTNYTSGSAEWAYISPDGQYVAYTTNAPSSLWLITPNNSAPIEVVPNSALAENDPQNMYIHNVLWGNDHILYFSTYFSSPTAGTRFLDFWSVDAVNRTYKQVFPIGEGGVFTLSPNREYIAFVQPGVYDNTDATLRIVDAASLSVLNTFSYPAVSSASSDEFIASMYWHLDNQSLNVAIPDKDLIYADDTAMTTLWRFGIDGTQFQLNSAQASFFGQPQWSNDGEYLTYMRHKGAIADNSFDLMVAEGDGSNPVVYVTGSAGTLSNPKWLPDSHKFIFAQNQAGEWWIGEPAQPAVPSISTGFEIEFVDSTTYLYAIGTTDDFNLYYADLNTSVSTRIAHLETLSTFTFDAVLIPPAS